MSNQRIPLPSYCICNCTQQISSRLQQTATVWATHVQTPARECQSDSAVLQDQVPRRLAEVTPRVFLPRSWQVPEAGRCRCSRLEAQDPGVSCTSRARQIPGHGCHVILSSSTAPGASRPGAFLPGIPPFSLRNELKSGLAAQHHTHAHWVARPIYRPTQAGGTDRGTFFVAQAHGVRPHLLGARAWEF